MPASVDRQHVLDRVYYTDSFSADVRGASDVHRMVVGYLLRHAIRSA